jgi:hypothetical protein
MARKPTNQGKAWTQAWESQLRKLAKGNTPTRLMAYRLGRTTVAVQSKAQELNISLKPVNKSPYNRHK